VENLEQNHQDPFLNIAVDVLGYVDVGHFNARVLRYLCAEDVEERQLGIQLAVKTLQYKELITGMPMTEGQEDRLTFIGNKLSQKKLSFPTIAHLCAEPESAPVHMKSFYNYLG